MRVLLYILGLGYFSVGRHENTVDENDQHHQQAEERAFLVKAWNTEHRHIATIHKH